MGAVVALIFWADVFFPDPIPYLDELILFVLAFILNAKNKSLFWTTMALLGGVAEWFIKLP